MTTMEEIRDYWNISPPMKSDYEKGTLEWSRDITKHRWSVVPYIHKFLDADKYIGKNILDLGCGSGSDILEFAKAGAIIHGIDVTDKAVKITRSRLLAEDYNIFVQNIRTYNGKHIPYNNESFDMVYSGGVLHHTPYMDDLLAEIHRVLKPGGTFKAMVYHKDSLLYFYSILLRRFREGLDISRDAALSRWSEFREGCPYTRAFTRSEMKYKLHYFKDVQTWVTYCVYDEPTNRKLPGARLFDVEKTGVADIDFFFEQYNDDFNRQVKAKQGENYLEQYGWHLLIEAEK